MKAKQNLIGKAMLALFLGGVVFTGCKKESGFTSTSQEIPTTVQEDASSSISSDATAARANLLFETGFDGSNPFDERIMYKQGCCSYSVTQSTTTVHEGSGSFRAEVKASDAAVSSGYRAELMFQEYNASEIWYGYSSYFENWNSFSGGEHVIQWHPNNGTGSAELSLQTASNKFDVVRAVGSVVRQPGTLKTIVSNKWYDFVWHIKWSTGSTGLIELWIDGEKYFTYTGKNMSSTIPYFKLGINRWNMGSSSRILYYDNLRIGNASATYNDVAPGAGSTTPPPTTPPPTTPPPTGTNQAPIVSAGPAKTITMPTTSVTLTGTASDPDGTIASYAWSKISGTGGFSNVLNQATINITGLSVGNYVFNLKATDNKGLAANSTVAVTVNASGTTPPPTTPPPTTPPPTTPPPTGLGTLTYSMGYNNTSDVNTSQGMYNSISRTIFSEGTGSFRSEVQGSQASQSSGYRSEMQYNSAAQNPAEGVTEYDVYYENWKAVSGGGHSFQWHPNSSSGSAVLSLQNYGGKFNIVRSIGGTNTHQSGTLMTTAPNRWYKFRWEVKWSTSSNGYIRVYIDNVLYYSYTGVTSEGSGTPYLKVGQNRWSMTGGQNTIVYYDNLKVYKK